MVHAVIDASVIASWFLSDEGHGKYDDILNSIDKIKIHVPSIFEYEFMNILLNAEKRRRVNYATVIEIVETIGRYPIEIGSLTVDLTEKMNVFKMARIYDLTIYGAAYLELAVRLNAPLITYDKLLSDSARKLKVKTIL